MSSAFVDDTHTTFPEFRGDAVMGDRLADHQQASGGMIAKEQLRLGAALRPRKGSSAARLKTIASILAQRSDCEVATFNEDSGCAASLIIFEAIVYNSLRAAKTPDVGGAD